MKISKNLVPEIYRLANEVYNGNISINQAIVMISANNQLNSGSARVLLNNFRLIRDGKLYKRTNNTYITEFFLKNIYNDFGEFGLKNALMALQQHIKYFEGLRKVTRHNLREIYLRYSGLIKCNPDECEQNEIINEINKSKQTKESIIQELSKLKATDPESIRIKGKRFKRDNKTIAQIKFLRDFKCQICSTAIRKKDGSFYVEAAHIIPKRKKGPELPDNILILCPNHHKEFDYGDLIILNKSTKVVNLILNGQKHKIKIDFK